MPVTSAAGHEEDKVKGRGAAVPSPAEHLEKIQSKTGAPVSRRSGTAGDTVREVTVPSVASLQDDFAKIEAAERKAQAKIEKASFQQVHGGQPTKLLQVLAEGEGDGKGEELGVGAGVQKGGLVYPSDEAGYWYEPTPRFEWGTVQERGPGGWSFQARAPSHPQASWAAAPVDPAAQWQEGEGFLPPIPPGQPTEHIFEVPSPSTADCTEAWCTQVRFGRRWWCLADVFIWPLGVCSDRGDASQHRNAGSIIMTRRLNCV